MASMGTTSAPSVKVKSASEKHKVLSKDNPQSNPQKASTPKMDKGAAVNTPKY